MAITLDVKLALQDRELRRDAERLRNDVGRDFQRDMDRIGQQSGIALADTFGRTAAPRMRKAMNGVADAAESATMKHANLNAELVKHEAVSRRVSAVTGELNRKRESGTLTIETETRLTNRLIRERVNEANVLKRVTKARADYDRALRIYGDKRSSLVPNVDTTGAVDQLARLGVTMGALSKIAGPAALVVMGAGLFQVASGAAAASQSLLVIPAALSAVGAGFLALKVGTQGFSDALDNMADPEKFASSLANLAPAAADAALSIKALVDGPIADLRRATQEALFDGVGPILTNLGSTYAQPIQQMTTQIAQAFNTMFQGIGDQLMDPNSQAALRDTMSNIGSAFQAAAPAAKSFAQAFVDIASVGSSFLPGLGQGAANLAQQFANFIRDARDSGKLHQWMQDGLDAITQLADMAKSAGEMFLAMAGHGKEFLPGIAQETRELADAFKGVLNFVDKINTALDTLKNAVNLLINPFQGIKGFAEQLGLIDKPTTPQNGMLGGGGGFDPQPTTILPALSPPGRLGGSVLGLQSTGGWSASNPFAQSSRGGGGAEADRYAGLDIRNYLPPNMPTGGYPGDAALLANVPAGRYDPTGDLTKGLEDCSSYIEDLVNLMDGMPTDGRQMSTGNAAEWLTTHGFLSGYMPGAFNVGFNGAHMQATLPDGTPVNWGSDAAAANRGIGGTGALDPAFTQHYYRPVGAASSDYHDVQRAGWDWAKALREEAATNRDPKADQSDKADAHQQAVEAGWKYNESLNKLLQAQNGTYNKLSSSADKFTNGMQQLGAKIDDDFGISKGLGGIAENITKFLANLAMAPVFGALSGVTSAYGTPGPGTGLLGAFAPRQNAFGQPMPDVLGRVMPQDGTTTAPGGYSPIPSAPTTPIPGGAISAPGVITPPGTQTSPYAPLTGPQLTNPGLTTPTPLGPMVGSPGQGYPTPWNPALSTGTRSTPSMGIAPGQGMPTSPGIGIGSGGLLGLAGSAASAAAGLAAGAGSMGGGGAAASAAAQIGIDEINRAIGFGAQAVGIGVQGLMETFLPVESQLADPTRGWFGRILGGVAGIRPVAQNVAGNKSGDQLTPEQVDKRDKERGIGSGDTNNTTNNVNVNAELHGQPDANARALNDLSWRAAAPAGGR
ncbi:hypothetical protein ACXDF8_11495 [Mycolicibacterium sp. CBM1]